MYNGIGLTTPRGSGTNGYVQRNLANFYKAKDKDDYRKPSELGAPAIRKPNRDIIEHDKKRKVELKCLEFQQMLEDQGYKEIEIFKRVSTYRQIILESVPDKNIQGQVPTKETHEIAEAQQRKNEKLRQAFGISDSFIDGSSFDPERRAKEAAAQAASVVAEKYILIPSPSSSDVESDIASMHAKKRTRVLNSSSVETEKKKKKHKRKRSSSETADGTNYRACVQSEKYLSFEETKCVEASRTSTHPSIASAIEKRECEKNSSEGYTSEMTSKKMARKHHFSNENYFSMENTSVDKYYRRNTVDRFRDERIPSANSYSNVKESNEDESQDRYRKKMSDWQKTERSSALDDGSPSDWTKRSRCSKNNRDVDLRKQLPTEKRGICLDGKMRSSSRRECKSRRRSCSKTPLTTNDYSQFDMNMEYKTLKSISSKTTVQHSSPGNRFVFHESTYERESGCDHESATPAKHDVREKEVAKETSEDQLTLREKRGERSSHSEPDTLSPHRHSWLKIDENEGHSSVLPFKVEHSDSRIMADHSVSLVRDKSSPLKYSPAERYSGVLADASNNRLKRQEFSKTPVARSSRSSKADEERVKTQVLFHELTKTGDYLPSWRTNSDNKDKSRRSADHTSDMIDEAVKKTASALEMDREKTLESLRKLLSSSIENSKITRNKEKNVNDKMKIKRKRKKNRDKNRRSSSSCFRKNKMTRSKSSNLSSLSSSDSSLSSRSHITSSSTSGSSGSCNRRNSASSNSSTSCSGTTSSNSTSSDRSNNSSSSSRSSSSGPNSSSSSGNSRSSSSSSNSSSSSSSSSRHSSNSSSVSKSNSGSGSITKNDNNKVNSNTKMASRELRRKHRHCSRSNFPTAYRYEHSASHDSSNPDRSLFGRSDSVSKDRKTKNKYHKGHDGKRKSDLKSSSRSSLSNNPFELSSNSRRKYSRKFSERRRVRSENHLNSLSPASPSSDTPVSLHSSSD